MEREKTKLNCAFLFFLFFLNKKIKNHKQQVAQLVTFLSQPASSVQIAPQQPIALPQMTEIYESRATSTNLTTFQANMPLSTFQASDKSSISPTGSSLGYTKDSPIGSSIGQNSCENNYDKNSPNGSSVGQTSPLVYGSQKRAKDLNVGTFGRSRSGTRSRSSDQLGGISPTPDATPNTFDQELNSQWEFKSSVDATNYTILSECLPGHDYLFDDFTILGFRPQDEITTEL